MSIDLPDAGPSATDVLAYLGADTTWSEDAVSQALAAEAYDQAARCRFPDGTYNDALREALFRRVAHNLAVRALPLGVQESITEGAVATSQVGGTDAEVRRLEAPYRRRTVA